MRRVLATIAALAALLAAASAQAQELGRLFFTPEQRAALDARRKARVPDKPAATPQADSPITRINGAVAQLDQGTQQNAALVEESTAAAESLREQAHRLVEQVGQFRV